jgi:GT2 family glycosyltransferase
VSSLVSIVVVACEKVDYTKRCLQSLACTQDTAWELIVVDNGSRDGTADWLEEFKQSPEMAGRQVTLILNDSNVGAVTARNMALDRVQGDRIVFMDNDVVVRSRAWLAGLTEVLGSDEKIGLVAPKLVYPFAPYRIQCAGGAVSKTGKIQFVGRGEARDDPRFNSRREVQCCISACWMMRRSIVEEIGPMDEVFNPAQYEDIDYCYRMRDRGYKIIYVPTVEMYHFESVTTAGTASLCNPAIVVRHGLVFKERWRRMFENEDGPSDEETRWRKLDSVDVHEVGDLEIMD